MKYILFKRDTPGNDEGDMVPVEMVEGNQVYYQDQNRRWCYLDVIDDADTIAIIEQDTVLDDELVVRQAFYMRQHGNVCPWCGSEEIEGNERDADGMSAWQAVECGACGAHWVDDYRLTGISDLYPGAIELRRLLP